MRVSLPECHPQGRAHSQQFKAFFAAQYGGRAVPFDCFMEAALFAPGLGYYSAGCTKLGMGGDFVTAPEVSPLFSQALAVQCQSIMAEMPDAAILELGPGRATMALDMMRAFQKAGTQLPQYYCLERSADLRQRQQQTIREAWPEVFPHFHWLDGLPDDFSGIVVANEVADCLPVSRFRIQQGKILEYTVALLDDRFVGQWQQPLTPGLIEQVSQLPGFPWQEGYTSEIALGLAAWMQSLADCLHRGVIVCIDYGYASRDYYHPQRHMGSLMCHYQHHAHDDPLIYVGCQDITAHVDFTRMAFAGHDAGLAVMGYASQAAFLLNNDLLQSLPSGDDPLQAYRHQRAVTQLTSPNEMGECFKVMAFAKNWTSPLQGFRQFDQSNRL